MLRRMIQNIGIILASLLIYLSICTEATSYLRQSFANGHVRRSFIDFADTANIRAHGREDNRVEDGEKSCVKIRWQTGGWLCPLHEARAEADGGIVARESSFLSPELSVGRIIIVQNA